VPTHTSSLSPPIGTISTSNQNISPMADKRESGEVQPEIPEDKQGPDQHEPTIEDRPRLGSDKELQKLDEWWLRYSQDREREQEHELQRKNAEIQHLTVGLLLMISMLFLIS